MTQVYKENYATFENCYDILERDGYCVIPGILNPEETEDAINKAWGCLNHLTQNLERPIVQDDPQSWLSFWELAPLHSMMLKHYVGHSQFMWDIRQNANVKKVFQTIHKDEDILTSFDGFSMHFPFEKLPRKRGKGRGNEWFHTDQSPHRKELCVQGIVNLFDVNEGDATLRVIERSHLKHADFFKERKIEKCSGDWYRPDENEMLYFKDLPKIHVKAKAGDMLLWNSKTFHCGGEASGTRKEPNFRLAAYVCMVPRRNATSAQLKKKCKAFKDKRMTSHWPIETKLNAKNPRTWGKALPDIMELPDPIVLDKNIAGF